VGATVGGRATTDDDDDDEDEDEDALTRKNNCTSCWSGTRFFLNCISGGVLVGATVGGRATTDDDDDDDDDEDEDALTRKNNKIFRKEANADKTLEMIIRQLMVERDKSESV
jgi:hypothetical protein